MFDYSHLLNYMHPSYLTGNPAWGGGFFNNLGSVPPWMFGGQNGNPGFGPNPSWGFGGQNSGQPTGGGYDPTGLTSGGMPGVGAPGNPDFGQVNTGGGGTNSLGFPPWLMNSLQVAARGGPTNFGQLLGNITPQVGSTDPAAGRSNLGGLSLPATSSFNNNSNYNVTGVGNPNPPTSFPSLPPNLMGGGPALSMPNDPNMRLGGGVRYNG